MRLDVLESQDELFVQEGRLYQVLSGLRETEKEMNSNAPEKPLGHKAYGSIPHLPGSRMGPADHHCHKGQAEICLDKVRDRHDKIIIQEKLDGSCVAVARVSGQLIALGRSGYPAQTSNYEQHQLFADWVRHNSDRFSFLSDGERVVGEWLAQAHGTRYKLNHMPFVAFDLMIGQIRAPFEKARDTMSHLLPMPLVLAFEPTPLSVIKSKIEVSGHGALDPVEGAVWRVERKGKVDFLAKWVRLDKVDGCYLESVTGKGPVWNWRPS